MNFFFNNNLSIRAVIVCFYFVLIGLIKGLMGTEIMKIFIPVILFYGNKNNVCLGFV